VLSRPDKSLQANTANRELRLKIHKRRS